MAKAIDIDMDDKYKAECDARTIKQYHELMGDKQRYKKAMKLLEGEAEALDSVLEGGPDGRDIGEDDKGAYKAVSKAVKD